MGARYVIGQDRDRDRKRREELSRLKLHPGLTDAQTAEKAKFDAFYEKEDRDSRRRSELFYKNLLSRHGGPALTEGERNEYAELRDRYPPDPKTENPKYKELAALLRAEAGRDNSKPNDSEPSSVVQGCITSEADRGPATVRPAPSAAEKLKSAPPDVLSDAELREQLILAANHNVLPGEDIEDVGPVRVMLESGITLDDVLYALRGKVDRRAYPGNRALTSWSEHRFVLAVAEEYGCRVMLPVIKEKLKARGKPAYARASAKTACDDDGRTE
jgi:hypothetical protein